MISALVASMHAARLRSAASERRFRLLVQGSRNYAIPEALPPGVGTLGTRERALGLGGRIEVESEPDAGTTVRFVAPLQNLRR